jgi:hypothetical protein
MEGELLFRLAASDRRGESNVRVAQNPRGELFAEMRSALDDDATPVICCGRLVLKHLHSTHSVSLVPSPYWEGP